MLGMHIVDISIDIYLCAFAIVSTSTLHCWYVGSVVSIVATRIVHGVATILAPLIYLLWYSILKTTSLKIFVPMDLCHLSQVVPPGTGVCSVY